MSSRREESEAGSERVKEGWIGVMQEVMLAVLLTYGGVTMSHQDWRELQWIIGMLAEVQMFRGNTGIKPNASG